VNCWLTVWSGSERTWTLPTRFNRSKSKGFYRRRTRGIAWLKDSATEHVARMHQIKSVLERYGHPVVVLAESRIDTAFANGHLRVRGCACSDAEAEGGEEAVTR
jgi:hypothetical protein